MASVQRLIGWLRRLSWLTLVLIVVLALVPWGSPAHAQKTQVVSVERLRLEVGERLVKDGNQAVRELHFERATYLWALAYAVSPDSAMLLNLAEACRNGARPREAYALLQRFLQEDPGTARKTEIEAQSRLLLASLGDPSNVRALRLAQEHVQLGVTAYGTQDYNEATREFTLAYALSPTPDLLYNLANSQRKAESVAEALLLYEQYLKGTNATTQRGSAEVYRAEMVSALQRQTPTRKECPLGQTLLSDQCRCPEGSVSDRAGACIAIVKKCPRGEEIGLDNQCQCLNGSKRQVDGICKPGSLLSKWWLWTTVLGGAAIVAVALGVGLGLGLSNTEQIPAGTTIIEPKFP